MIQNTVKLILNTYDIFRVFYCGSIYLYNIVGIFLYGVFIEYYIILLCKRLHLSVKSYKILYKGGVANEKKITTYALYTYYFS